MFLSLFYRKVSQSYHIEGSWDLVQRWPTKAIDGPSSHLWTIVPSKDRIWWPSTRSSGIWRNSGKPDNVWGYRRIDRWIILLNHRYYQWISCIEVEEKLCMERQKASTDSRCIDGQCCWSVHWIRKNSSVRIEKNAKSRLTEEVNGPSFHRQAVRGGYRLKHHFWNTFLIWILLNLGQ